MIWNLFRKPATFNDTPRLKLYIVSLTETIPSAPGAPGTTPRDGENLMRVAATSPEDAREKALARARQIGIHLTEGAISNVTGGDRDA